MLMKLDQAFTVGQIVDYMPLYEPMSVPLPKCWYILRTAPNREFKVMKRFGQLGISGYLPTLNSRREFRRHKAGCDWIERRSVTSALITGAVLVPDFQIDAPALKHVDGLFGVLRFGDFVPTLTPKLMQDLRNIAAIGNTPKSKRDHYFEIGQLVRVLSGPFRGFSARVERFDSIGRLSVGIEIFSRITPAVMDEVDIEAV